MRPRAPREQEAGVDEPRQISRRALGIGAVAAVAATGVTVVLAGDGIDGSGVADSTADVQAMIDDAADGAVIAIPSGAVLRCTATVTLGGRGKTLSGPGELRFSDGDDLPVALRVTGPGSRVHQVTVAAPDESFSRGIEIAADDVTVDDCVVDRFRYGIVVAAEGEWVDTRILGNRVSNVIGSGGGRGSDSREGEDTGDGITVWGARATVSGNVVSALEGTDARVGIHGEGLGDAKRSDRPHSDAMVTVSGNVVTGPFRRCIVFEELDNGTMVGNTVADATWWGLAVIGGDGCLVSGNTVRYTRTDEDDQGSAYTPVRSAMLVYAGTGHILSGNTVSVLGSAEAFIALFALLGSPPTDVQVTGNNCRTTGGGTCRSGVVLVGEPGPVRPKIQGNTLVGVTRTLVDLGPALAPEVSGNTLIGSSDGCERGIAGSDAANDGALVVGNRVGGCDVGVQLSRQTGAVVSTNVIQDCEVAVDLSDSSGVVLVGNVAPRSGTAVRNPGSNQVLP